MAIERTKYMPNVGTFHVVLNGVEAYMFYLIPDDGWYYEHATPSNGRWHCTNPETLPVTGYIE